MRPDHLVVLDPTLLAPEAPAVADGGLVLVNSATAPCALMPGAGRVLAIDGARIARRCGLGPIVGTAMIGALAGVTGVVALDALRAAVAAGSPARSAGNVEACTLAFQEAASLLAVGPR